MQRLIYSVFLFVLAACSSTETSSRYHDISELERPPTLPSDPSYRPDSAYSLDDSRIERRQTGLASRVYLLEGNPLQLRIKQPIEKAWYTVAEAIKQNSLKISDYDRSKKVYFINYGESGGIFGLFANEPTNYLLALKEHGKETVVIATLTGEKDSSADDESEKLLRQLYDTIHDELRVE